MTTETTPEVPVGDLARPVKKPRNIFMLRYAPRAHASVSDDADGMPEIDIVMEKIPYADGEDDGAVLLSIATYLLQTYDAGHSVKTIGESLSLTGQWKKAGRAPTAFLPVRIAIETIRRSHDMSPLPIAVAFDVDEEIDKLFGESQFGLRLTRKPLDQRVEEYMKRRTSDPFCAMLLPSASPLLASKFDALEIIERYEDSFRIMLGLALDDAFYYWDDKTIVDCVAATCANVRGWLEMTRELWKELETDNRETALLRLRELKKCAEMFKTTGWKTMDVIKVGHRVEVVGAAFTEWATAVQPAQLVGTVKQMFVDQSSREIGAFVLFDAPVSPPFDALLVRALGKEPDLTPESGHSFPVAALRLLTDCNHYKPPSST